MFIFEMTVETTCEFYRRVTQLNAVTEEQRTHILFEMVREGLITGGETSLTKDEFVDVVSQQYNVLDLRENENEDSEKASETDGGEIGTAGN